MATRPNIFATKTITLAGTTEEVVVGGRDKFILLPAAFDGIKQIGVIGWSSQGPAQAQNLRDSLVNSGIRVVVGLRNGSPSFAKAADADFTVDNETAGEMYQVIGSSDLVILLIKDAAQAAEFEKIQSVMKPGATLGLSHGFLLGHMKNVGATFRDDINVIGVCPKGMGPAVRPLHVQGKQAQRAGVTSSYAVHQDFTGNARNIAHAWALAIGSPYVFETTLEQEYLSDISGERGTLLAGVWAVAEAMNDFYIGQGVLPQDAFARSAMSITGPISDTISRFGLIGIVDGIPMEKESEFFRTLHLAYRAALPIVEHIYNEVRTGREIANVIDQTKAAEKWGWTKVDGTKMWRTGEAVRKEGNVEIPLDARTSAAYLAIMLAQVDVLFANGHRWSEIANETIIEATDSLNPYMAARGIDYLIDNCSTTARLGGREWGPIFRQMIIGDVMPNVDTTNLPEDFRGWFFDHPIHDALAVCSKFKPRISISVQ